MANPPHNKGYGMNTYDFSPQVNKFVDDRCEKSHKALDASAEKVKSTVTPVVNNTVNVVIKKTIDKSVEWMNK